MSLSEGRRKKRAPNLCLCFEPGQASEIPNPANFAVTYCTPASSPSCSLVLPPLLPPGLSFLLNVSSGGQPSSCLSQRKTGSPSTDRNTVRPTVCIHCTAQLFVFFLPVSGAVHHPTVHKHVHKISASGTKKEQARCKRPHPPRVLRVSSGPTAMQQCAVPVFDVCVCVSVCRRLEGFTNEAGCRSGGLKLLVKGQ